MHHKPCLGPPGFGIHSQNVFKNLSGIKIYSYALLHQVKVDSLDFYREQIKIFCALYIRFPIDINLNEQLKTYTDIHGQLQSYMEKMFSFTTV